MCDRPVPGGSLLFGVGYKLLDLMGPMNSNETLNNFRGYMAIDIFRHEMALTLFRYRHGGTTLTVAGDSNNRVSKPKIREISACTHAHTHANISARNGITNSQK